MVSVMQSACLKRIIAWAHVQHSEAKFVSPFWVLAVPKCRHRLEEMKTATRLLGSAAEGTQVPGFDFLDAPQGFMSSLKGRLDMNCMAAMGHSFGGGPSCALPAISSLFKCGIGMDAYWWATFQFCIFLRPKYSSVRLLGIQVLQHISKYNSTLSMSPKIVPSSSMGPLASSSFL